MNNRKLLNQLYRKADAELTDEELLTGKAYGKYASDVASGMSEKYGNNIKVKISCDKREGANVACTNGNSIWVNAWSDAFGVIENLTVRHHIVLGLLVHECGHILWTNFKLAVQAGESIVKHHRLYPAPKADMSEFTDFLDLKPQAAGAVASLFHSVDNCVEDGFIEKLLLKKFPGYGTYLAMARARNEKDMPGVTEMRKTCDTLAIFVNLILWQAKFGHICELTPDEYEDEAVKGFYRVRELINAAVDERSSYFRMQKVSELFLEVFKVFKEQAEQNQQDQQSGNDDQSDDGNSQNGSHDGDDDGDDAAAADDDDGDDDDGDDTDADDDNDDGDGDGDGDEEDESESGCDEQEKIEGDNDVMEELIKALQDAADQAEQETQDGTSHENGESPAEDEAQSQSVSSGDDGDDEENSASSGQTEAGNPSSSSTLENIRKNEVEDRVSEEVDKMLTKQITCDVGDVAHDPGVHNGVRSVVKRANPEDGEALYNDEHQYLDSLARRMMKNLLKEIKDRQLGDALDGNYFGNRLDTNNLYRRDKKLYIKDIFPEDIPDMEISILIDCSGSMSGEKIRVARRTAYTVWKFCQMLKIPVTVLGHDTGNGGVRIFSVADGDSIDGADGKRIFSLHSGGCNRDGFALRTALQRLYRSPASDRIMFVISDGLPNDGSYDIEVGKADIRDAVAKAKKDGISVITAGIGESAEMIKNIWTEGVSVKRAATFLELEENLDRLPKSFVKVIKAQLAA